MTKYKLKINDAIYLRSNVLMGITDYPTIEVNYQSSQILNELEKIHEKFVEEQRKLMKKFGEKMHEKSQEYTVKDLQGADKEKYQSAVKDVLKSEIELSFSFNLIESIMKTPNFKAEGEGQSTLYSLLFQILTKSEVK